MFADKITLDWEHDSLVWVDPMEIPDDGQDDGFVPRIAEGLGRVHVERGLGPAAGQILARSLEELRSDHENGARVIAGLALVGLTRVAEAMMMGDGDNVFSAEGWWRNLRMAGWHLCRNGRPAMAAVIRSVVVGALWRVEEVCRGVFSSSSCSSPPSSSAASLGSDPLTPCQKEKILETLRHYRQERETAIKGISTAFAEYLREKHEEIMMNQPGVQQQREKARPLTIVTLSSSSTIARAIAHAAGDDSCSIPLRIHVLESRPLFEGVSAAQEFSLLPGVSQVSVYPDAGAAHAVRDADVVLLGADSISPRGAVSNKLGSLAAVLGAAYHHGSSNHHHYHLVAKKTGGRSCDVVVLGEKEKVAPDGGEEGHQEEDEENAASELTDAWQGLLDEGTEVVGPEGADDGDTVDATSLIPSASTTSEVQATRTTTMVAHKPVVTTTTNTNTTNPLGTEHEALHAPSSCSSPHRPKKPKSAASKSRLRVRNLYFEWADPGSRPLNELDWVYICETGRWDRKEIKRRAREVRERSDKFFVSL